MPKKTGRPAPSPPGVSEEEESGYPDPGQQWEVDRSHHPYDWQGLMVEYTEPEVTGVLFGPDGEVILEMTNERTFGFARWLDEA